MVEEAGLDAEDMVETTSELRDKLLALTHGKVDIMIDENTFKNTTQILREMSYAWQDMTDIEQAAALELMGGKRQGNILSSLISNFDTVEQVIQTSTNSAGSAMAENEKWLDSIEGKTYQFTNALETMWSNLLNAEAIKGFIDFGTEMIQFLDTVPGKITAVVAALAGIAKFKGYNIATLGTDALQSFKNMGTAQIALDSLNKNYSFDGLSGDQSTQLIQSYASAVSSLTPKLQANMLATNGLTQSQIQYAMKCNGVKQELIDEATAHIAVKNAKNQAKLSGEALVAAKIKESGVNLQLTGDSDKIAAGKYLEANASDLAKDAKAQETIANSDLSTSSKAAAQAAYIQATATNTLGASFKALLAANPTMVFSLLGAAVLAFSNSIEGTDDKIKDLKDSYNSLQDSISSAESEINSIDSELSTVQGKIDELSGKKLTITEAEELQKLKAQNAELEIQKENQEKILEGLNSQNQEKSLAMINNLISNTAANQENAAESASKWGKALGAVAGVLVGVGAVALAPFTGGGSLAAGVGLSASLAGAGTTALTAGYLFGQAGANIGEKKLGWLFEDDKYDSIDTLTEWYDSYIEAVNKADQEVRQAETEYLTTLGDSEYEKWQSKVEAANTLKTEMYDRLQEMQDYINNLEYNDQTKGIIDEYNNLMTHISASSMDGDINAQIQSLEALKAEYAELSKGVDENGNNIALSAEEYARYQAIVSQLLGYNSGLTQTFDENGNAILSANGNLVSYNSALETTIELLKQQQQLAAQNAIGLGDSNNSTFTDKYDSIISANSITNKNDNWYNNMPRALSVSKNPHGFLDGATWDMDDVAEEISQVIGVDYSLLFGNSDKYIGENIIAIKEHRDEIIEQLTSTMQDTNLDDASINSYVSQVESWLNGIIGESVKLTENAKTELKDLLYIVPQASDSYYDGSLSGNNLDFINSYIDSYVDYVDGIENIGDITDEKKVEIRDNILALTDAIGESPELQDAIDELFTLDPSSMSIASYEAEIKSKLATIFDGIDADILAESGLTSEKLFETLVPNTKQIDTMVDSVKSKLNTEIGDLREAFTQEELEIVYRATVKMADGSMSIDDLKDTLTDKFATFSGPIVQTASAMQAEIDTFNDIITQTGEILGDNTEVSQEYKDALEALGISKDELNEYFYEGNELVVKDANGLKNLVSRTTSLAKAQSQLKYYNLVQQLTNALGGTKNLANGTADLINVQLDEANALMSQISQLQQVIAQYQQLEATLLGTSNAFQAFAEAQEIDAQNTYGDSYVSMAQSIYDAYELTGQVATAQVDAAVEALIDPSVYAGLEKHSDEYNQAIYDAFNNTVLPNLTLDEDTISLEFDNIEDFVSENLGGIFEGVDTSDFDLAEGINFDDAIEMTGKTRTELYALFAELQKYTGENYLLQLDDSNAGQITKITTELQELNEQKLSLLEEKNSLEDQKIKLETEGGEEAQAEIEEINERIGEIDSQVGKVNTQLGETQSKLGPIADQVRETWEAYSDADTALEKLNEIEDKQREITESDFSEIFDGLELGIEWDDVKGKTIQEAIDLLIEKKLELGEPTPVELQVALDDIEADLVTLQEAKDNLEEGGTVEITLDGETATYDAEQLQTKIDELKNEKASITLRLQTEDGADISDKVDEVIRQLSIISGVEPVATLGVNNKEANEKIDETKDKADELDNKKPNVDATADTTEADSAIENTSEQVSALDNQTATATATADTTEADSKINNTEEQLNSVDGKTAEVSVETKNDGFEQEISEIDAKINELNQRKVEIQSDPTNIQNYALELLYIEGQLALLENRKVKLTVEADMAQTESILTALSEFQTTYETLKTTIEIGADTTQAEQDFQSAVSNLKQQNPEILAKLGIDMTNSTAQINSVISSLTPEIMVNCGLNKTAVDAFVGTEHTANGTVNWTNNTTAVDEYAAEEKTAEGTVTWDNNTSAVDSWIAQNHEAYGTVNWTNDTSSVKTSFTATGTVTWTNSGSSEVNGTANASGTAHVNGTAFKGGNWGAPRTETALVGELGPELLVRGNRWTTIGDNGAEFTQIRQGDIIFNHKQTRELLSNGHITGRGKAYASGTAYGSLWGPSGGYGGGGSSSYDDDYDYDDYDYDDYSDSYDDATDSAEEFEETLDWIEILLEEINEQIDLMSAKLENAVGYVNKNSIVDKLIDTNKNKMKKIQEGIEEYKDYLGDLLYEIPSRYRDAAQNGAIDIEEFYGEADEETVEAINNYREWAAKVADLTQQFEELNTEIANLAKQKLDNISDYFNNKIGIYENIEDYIDSYVGYIEDLGYVASVKSYEYMDKALQKRLGLLREEKELLLDNFNQQVKNGNIKVGSEAWYEVVDALYEIDKEINDCHATTVEYQNAIKNIRWDNAEQLLDRLKGISDETQNLIDLMEASGDLVDENGEWTKEGVASLGLYAQKMENAAYVADQYSRAMKVIEKDYQRGYYSEAEYLEKLNELKDGQYEATQAYYEAQDAIVELNKTRVDAIKDGIEKEIEAYEELIEKKKEELDAEKD